MKNFSEKTSCTTSCNVAGYSFGNFIKTNEVKSVAAVDVAPAVDPIIFGADFEEKIKDVQKHLELTKKFIVSVINGVHRNALLQGPPGMGKSHVVSEVLREAGMQEKKDYFVVKGHITPSKLFLLLYLMRSKGQVLVLDDCDDIFKTEIGINLIKAALDMENRMVSYQSPRMPLVNGVPIGDFEYEGTLIICTNIDYRSRVVGRVAQHMAAVLSRAILWPLLWDTPIRKFAQIYNMVVNVDYLKSDAATSLDQRQKTELLKFIWNELSSIRELDLRLPGKMAAEIKSNPQWRETCRVFVGI